MRIITGTAKGCRLKAPKGMGTRPTADRVKESLFNILGQSVRGSFVLDIFAGTGALGLEALSRGAIGAVFIDKATANVILSNATHTKLADRAEIIAGDVSKVLPRLEKRGLSFDMIFADPPYNLGLESSLLDFIDRGSLLRAGGIVVLEHSAETVLPTTQNLTLTRRENYGSQICLSFLQNR